MPSTTAATVPLLDSLWHKINSRILLMATIVFLLSYLVVKQSRKKLNIPPGPRAWWPIIGHLASLDRISPYRTMASLAKQYGPVISLKFGSFPVVVLNDYASVHQAFVKQGSEFDDRPNTILTEISKGKGLVLCTSGEAQRARRRFAMASLRNLGMGRFRLEENIVAEIDRLVNKFDSYNSKPFCPFLLLESAFSNVLCCLAFGKRYEYDDPKFQHLLHVLAEVMEIASYAGAVNFIPFLKYIPFSKTRKLIVPEFKQFFEDMVKENATDYTPNQPRNFIDMYLDNQELIKEQEPDMAHAFDYDDLIRCLGDLFAVGTDTSATITKWAIQYMMMHPKVQERVHEELDRVIGQERMSSLKDRPNLPYTEATLNEIQRFASILPVGVPHATNVDTRLNGYDVPKGTVVMANLWAVHHDPQTWDEPQEFRPERFLDSEGKLQKRDDVIPFCIGRRECLGKQLAYMEVFLYFTHLMQKFEFRLPEGAAIPSTTGILGNTLSPQSFDVCAIARVK